MTTLATRVMKARRAGTCRLCGGAIQRRELIAKVGYWVHAQCVIDRLHEGDGQDREDQ